MEALQYADALSIHSGFSLVRDEREGYDVAAKRTREAQTDALREENAKLAAERDARERAKEIEREKKHGPRVRFAMIDGLRADDVDRAIFRGRRAGDIGHRTVAFYLADCADRGLYQELGHSSAVVYAVKRHELSRRSARELIAAGRALRELSKIDQAFAEARISWSKARALAKVAEPPTEDRWLAYAKTHTLEEVEKEVALSRKGDEPREDRKGLPEVRFDVRLRVSALLHEQYLLARQKLGADVGRDVTDEEFAGAVLESVLRKPAEGNQSSDSLYRVVLDLNPAGNKVSIRSEDGPIDLDAARAEAICCDAGVISEHGHDHGGHAPPISDALRKKILARDKWRCRACRLPAQLHVHHIVFRSEHGSNAWSNLLGLCSLRHTLVHGRYLSITGRAPDRLEIRDRKGELVEDPSRVIAEEDRLSLEIVPPPPLAAGSPPDASGAAAPPDSGFSAGKPGVPEAVDGNWLARHDHLLNLDATNAVFRLEPGKPRDGQSMVREDDAPYSVTRGEMRPATLDDVIGQHDAVARLYTYIHAARNTGTMPPPILFLGDTGLGKTTLARAYADALGARLKLIDGSTLETPLGLVRQLFDLRDGDVVFLDEIHALRRSLVECLYPTVEDGVMPLRFADGLAIRTVPFILPKLAWVAATTNPERMTGAFRGRFRSVELRPYETEDLVEIICRAANRAGCAIDPGTAAVLAKASAGNARAALGLYTEARMVVAARRGVSMTTDDAQTMLRLAELDENGIGPVQRRILDILRRHGRPMAAGRLAAQAGITPQALRTIYEGPLVASRAIVLTRFGMALGTAM